MYLAMSRQAERDGYPEIADAYKRYAYEEAEHAAKFAELLGEVVTNNTKKNLELRAEAEETAHAPESLLWQNGPRNWIWTPSMIPFMKWPRTRPATAEVLTGLLARYFSK